MLQKIEKTAFRGHGPIKILYPGALLSNEDTGIGSIGRIDHPEIHGNTVIAMHPHINDEILSYFRTGKAEHTDSEGFEKTIGSNTLMFMKAGKSFYHEEKILGEDEPLEGLQIFIRPGKKDLKPEVIFRDLEQVHSENEWRLLGAPTAETTFQFSSQTWVYDMKLMKGQTAKLPELHKEGLTFLLYTFKGQAIINNAIQLDKKEALIIRDEKINIFSQDDTEFVLFVTDEKGEIFKNGMYSGNQFA
ncbi:pirin family protein [Pedobacter sp. MC2016-14]|uniref:pirin family protein n=1 Tax=Pedobacter sp. MC2016-14 TaxID=2897327 RepID=UPI001E50913C|nr:pirin family protein [Pedobacter sp. MC2016-14]MCD0489877.1 pirin family protein [Pedobacter sp. MC2016-14]